MKSAAKNIQLASYDDLFKTDEERQADAQERVQSLPLDKLEPFPNHPFKVIDDDKMLETVESIKERGVLVPILVRPKNDGNFEIVSGHRRHHASQLAGLTEIPAIVREMDDDTAILLMVDSNLQREELLPSEKAFAYKMKLDAMKRQGQRTDLTCARIAHKFDGMKSRDILAEEVGESKDQVRRYIRLTYLVTDLLDRVDNKTMAFTDVVTIDEERIDLIRTVFWDMNTVSYYVQTIEHEDSTETILHITITSKKATDMPDFYYFNKSQREALEEVLKPEYAQMLAELVGTYGGEVTLDDAQIRAMLATMPKDISERRRAVVEKAYSLLGKVNYFWGGKSSAIGWDSRWGKPTRVTAAGSRTTGTIRPYGLDCSGFVDWVFNNSLGYVIGHGGGAASQHDYCKPISWSEAQPGDLVFYPGDTHVGVFVGKDSNGDPLIIHCASSQNNVVLTGLQGFVSIGRPDCF